MSSSHFYRITLKKIVVLFSLLNFFLFAFLMTSKTNNEKTYELLENARKARDLHLYERQRFLLEKVINERVKVLGPNHPGLAKLYSRMAHSYVSSNNLRPASKELSDNFDHAEYFIDKAIVLARNQSNLQNWQLGLYVAQKGNILLERAGYGLHHVPQRAIMLIEQALKILEKGLGEQSPEFQITKTILARALKEKGDCKLSTKLLNQTLSWFEDNLPSDSERLALQYESLAKSQICSGLYDQAIESSNLALSIYDGNKEYRKSIIILNYQNGILNLLQGNKTEAVRLLRLADGESNENLYPLLSEIITQDLSYLVGYSGEPRSFETLLEYRSLLRKRRIFFQNQNAKVRLFYPGIILGLEALIDHQTDSVLGIDKSR